MGAAIGAGAAQARLDPSFGQNGVVTVEPPFPSGSYHYIREMGASRDGSSYVLYERDSCGYRGCGGFLSLIRYGSDGTLDTAFGSGGTYDLPREGVGLEAFAVDPQGRPLLAETTYHALIVRRLTASGSPDPSFGQNGVVELQCGCYGLSQLLVDREGKVTMVSARTRRRPEAHGQRKRETIFRVIRVQADGSLDRRFGGGGEATFGLVGAEGLSAAAVSRNGVLYLAGSRCCALSHSDYVVRVSGRGRFDSRFAAVARGSMQALRRLNAFQATVSTVLVRRRGRIDLLGGSDQDKGFELRLRPSGRLDRGFGRRGLRELPLPVSSAGLGSDGVTMAVSGENLASRPTVMRILAGGRIDPAFGLEPLPDSQGSSGVSIVPQAGRKALVLDPGLNQCRGVCPDRPKLVRFLEGPRKRR
ncbi:MAG: hypothetical protein ACTHLH_03160 [Solirubrobacterales bacterium]